MIKTNDFSPNQDPEKESPPADLQLITTEKVIKLECNEYEEVKPNTNQIQVSDQKLNKSNRLEIPCSLTLPRSEDEKAILKLDGGFCIELYQPSTTVPGVEAWSCSQHWHGSLTSWPASLSRWSPPKHSVSRPSLRSFSAHTICSWLASSLATSPPLTFQSQLHAIAPGRGARAWIGNSASHQQPALAPPRAGGWMVLKSPASTSCPTPRLTWP